jgi:hypothetical protein
LSLVPGRRVVLRLSAWANKRYDKKVGLRDLVATFREEDLDPEVSAVLGALASDELVAEIHPARSGWEWPRDETQPGSARPRQSAQAELTADYILEIFNAAGVFE